MLKTLGFRTLIIKYKIVGIKSINVRFSNAFKDFDNLIMGYLQGVEL